MVIACLCQKQREAYTPSVSSFSLGTFVVLRCFDWSFTRWDEKKKKKYHTIFIYSMAKTVVYYEFLTASLSAHLLRMFVGNVDHIFIHQSNVLQLTTQLSSCSAWNIFITWIPVPFIRLLHFPKLNIHRKTFSFFMSKSKAEISLLHRCHVTNHPWSSGRDQFQWSKVHDLGPLKLHVSTSS